MRPITAADLMNPEVLTVGEAMPVEDLARFLIANEISGAPVEGADGRLVGVVSLHDIVAYVIEDDEDEDGEAAEAEDGTPADPAAAEAPGDGSADETGSDSGDESGDDSGDDSLDLMGEELLVEDIMTPKVVSVSEDATVPEIASLMLKEHLHRLLVMDNDEPRGIISTSDLLGLLVDEE